MLITSVDNPRIKELCKLKTSKGRKKEGKFLVEGAHLVNEARKCGCLLEAYSLTEKEGYITITDNVMRKLSQTDTVVPEIGLCRIVKKEELADRILILDGVQDPGNMGALMRSAKAFGFDTIVLGEGSCDIYNDKAIRSSQGAIFKLSFIQADLLEYIPALKGYTIYGTNVVNGIILAEAIASDKLALILGNEGNGVRKEVQALADKNLYIPMHNTESLNVSVAGSIIMYSLRAK